MAAAIESKSNRGCVESNRYESISRQPLHNHIPIAWNRWISRQYHVDLDSLRTSVRSKAALRLSQSKLYKQHVYEYHSFAQLPLARSTYAADSQHQISAISPLLLQTPGNVHHLFVRLYHRYSASIGTSQ